MAVSIAGLARIGRQLVAVPTTAYADSTYQWQSSDSEGGSYSNITGATSQSFIPRTEDAWRGPLWLKVVHSFIDSEPASETSAAFGPILAQQGAAAPAQPRMLLRYYRSAKKNFQRRSTSRQLQREVG